MVEGQWRQGTDGMPLHGFRIVVSGHRRAAGAIVHAQREHVAAHPGVCSVARVAATAFIRADRHE